MCHKQNIVPDIMHITSRRVIYMCDYEDYSFVVEKAYDKIANCNIKLKQFFVDEIATTGTKHMHIFIYSKSPIRF